jgi:hypothetical protein
MVLVPKESRTVQIARRRVRVHAHSVASSFSEVNDCRLAAPAVTPACAAMLLPGSIVSRDHLVLLAASVSRWSHRSLGTRGTSRQIARDHASYAKEEAIAGTAPFLKGSDKSSQRLER